MKTQNKELNDRQWAMIANDYNIVETYGPYEKWYDNDGAHYIEYGPNQPNADLGIKCSNCWYFNYENGDYDDAYDAYMGWCDIVCGDIHPGASCKRWVIADELLTANPPVEMPIEPEPIVFTLEKKEIVHFFNPSAKTPLDENGDPKYCSGGFCATSTTGDSE